jgi:hypothetical protein
LAGKKGVCFTKQLCNPLLVRGSIQCQPCSKPRAVFAARSFLAVSEEAGKHKRFAAEQLAPMTTSMFVDRSCFQLATNWMRQYMAPTA